MSEELRTEELLTNEGHTETMADYEDHFDDANPWNRVLEYMEKKTILPVKIEGIVNGGAIAMVSTNNVDWNPALSGMYPVSFRILLVPCSRWKGAEYTHFSTCRPRESPHASH